MNIAADLSIVVVAGLVGALVAHVLRQPLILGYLAAGILLGPGLANAISDPANLELLAEIGVTLLLFGLGLELSIKEMQPVRRVALAGTAIQMVVCTTLGTLFGRWLGFDWVPSVWFGALVSVSSTIVVIKTLQSQGRIGTLSSRVMLGMLVAQDLAVIPLMIVLPRLASPDASLVTVAAGIAKAAFMLAAIATVGAKVFPWIIERVARSRSRELFLLVVTGLALGVGYVTHFFGLSAALGAFVAGLVLSESDYSHQALADIIPLRDVFSLLFFASVGTLLDPRPLLEQLPLVLSTIAVVGLGKGLVFAGVVRAFGYRNVIPLASGLALFQVGEFSFVLGRVGLTSGAISTDLYTLVLHTALLTMTMTPLVAGLTTPAYGWLSRRRSREPVQTINMPATALENHVVVVGAGRVGSALASVLQQLKLPFVVVEIEHRRFEHAKHEGFPIVYGDASQPTVLEAAHVENARLVLVTTPDLMSARTLIEHVRAVNPKTDIVVRAEDFVVAKTLQHLAVTEVVQPEFEASLEMTRQALLHLEVPTPEILALTDRLRSDRYAATYARHPDAYAELSRLGAASRFLDLRWIRVQPLSAVAGRTIGELQVRSAMGISIVGIVRNGLLRSNPGPDERFEDADLVAVVGNREALAGFERAASGATAGLPPA
jgi:CPA2 family monovalent cation:H+ antiporter-2